MRRLTFSDGIGITLAILGLGALWLLGARGGGFLAMYKDFGQSARLPRVTILVLQPWFRIVVPTVLMAATAGALVFRPRFAVLAVGIACSAIAIFMWIAAYQPIWALAGNISAD